MTAQPVDQVESRVCPQCRRGFTVPLTGRGRNRQKCETCSPPMRPSGVISPPADNDWPPTQPLSAPVVHSEPIPEVPKVPRPPGRFETRTGEILGKFKKPDEGRVLAATALARALDDPEITPPQIASVTKQWLAVIDQIQIGEPLEPDEMDEVSNRATEKKLRRL